jgi:hypothetical protein
MSSKRARASVYQKEYNMLIAMLKSSCTVDEQDVWKVTSPYKLSPLATVRIVTANSKVNSNMVFSDACTHCKNDGDDADTKHTQRKTCCCSTKEK